MCVCVRERESSQERYTHTHTQTHGDRERESERERERAREGDRLVGNPGTLAVCARLPMLRSKYFTETWRAGATIALFSTARRGFFLRRVL